MWTKGVSCLPESLRTEWKEGKQRAVVRMEKELTIQLSVGYRQSIGASGHVYSVTTAATILCLLLS